MLMAKTRDLHVRLDDELAQWLETEARERMVSQAFLVTRAVERLRDSMPAASS